MEILFGFAFLSGLVTIFAPCIWPLLPIILGASATGGHRKPLGITLGIILSFGFFTLALSYIVTILPIDANALRLFAVLVIGFFGIMLLFPPISTKVEGFVSRFSGRFASGTPRNGFWGGFITGLSLGIVWAPCAGPILGTIATLAATQKVSSATVLVTVFYVLGIGIPLFLFATLGNKLFSQNRVISKYSGRIQQVFGVIMIITALLIYTNYDKVLEAKLLNLFPSYSGFLNGLEGNKTVQTELAKLKDQTPLSLEAGSSSSAPDFTGGTQWLNSKPLSIKDLRGKVVLVDFWTYTCINCIRTLPHVTSWYDTYNKDGFVVIGVHTPEFAFEKVTDNVKNAIAQYGIHYPVVQDNDYAIWNAYTNQYWPAEYLIDKNGKIRHTNFGEGDYDGTEMEIRNLLKEAGASVSASLTNMPDQTPVGNLTQETYVGSNRLGYVASNEAVSGGMQSFTKPEALPQDAFAFSGTWDVESEYAQAQQNASLVFSVNADKVYLVITPKTKNDKVKVLLDGKTVDSSNAGVDVKDGYVQFNATLQQRLYNLIDLQGNPGNHVLELQFETGGTQLFAFTFG